MTDNNPKERSALPWLIGCGSLILILCIAAVVLFVVNFPAIKESFSSSFDFEEWEDWEEWEEEEWGVKAPNEMSEEAHAFLDKEKLVKKSETLLAYYDMYADETEVAVLTDQAIKYYKKGRVTEVPLQDVKKVTHQQRDEWDGTIDVILIRYKGGQQMKVEVLEYEGGETLYEMVKEAWKEARP